MSPKPLPPTSTSSPREVRDGVAMGQGPDRPLADEMRADSDDALLRALLRDALPQALPEGGAGTAALQQRVLAQWQAVHAPAAEAAPAFVVAGSGAATAHIGGSGGRRLGPAWRLVALALAALLVLAAAPRPDPVLQELLPVDVLSELAGGAL